MLLRRGYAAHFAERLGFLPRRFSTNAPRAIWLHAVSVGEVTSLVPLLRLIRKELPEAPVYLSTSTVAGRQVAEKHAASLVNGIFYLPLDFGVCVRRAFRSIRPALLVIVETELWPTLFSTAYYSGTSVAVINGRVSDRAWPTYRRWKALFASTVRVPGLVQVQSEVDRQRYAELGVAASHLVIDANLKFDATVPVMPSSLPTFGAQQIWIAASTVGPNERGSKTAHTVDEDDIVLSAFQELAGEFPALLLILAPRQPARFPAVAEKLKALGLNVARRSSPEAELQLPGVLLLDTLGELASAYPLAHVVFVGGSIAPRGGHNIIEAAVAGAPIIVGPHMHNFETITRSFLEGAAILQIQDAAELGPTVRALLLDRTRSRRLGRKAQDLVRNQQGVSRRALQHLTPLYFRGSFEPTHNMPVQVLFNALSSLWQFGGKLKRKRGQQLASKRQALPIPVISVGGLGVGGAGKTPFAIALAKSLREAGARPAILTRGYKRRGTASIVAAPGAKLSVDKTGDEAQILLQAGVAPVGIGTDRYESAVNLVKEFPATNVLILDDGFQHASLARSLDIVLIDALNPFSNGRVVPTGRLREPLEALERAQIVVITRSRSDAQFAALAECVRSAKAGAEVFRSDIVTKGWRNADTGAEGQLAPSAKAGAFCGLGNPESFWRTLDALGVQTVLRRAFKDHHRYTPSDVANVAAQARSKGADVLLTTEKDFFNLPENRLGVQLLYLPIELVIQEQERFLEAVKMAIDGKRPDLRNEKFAGDTCGR